MKTYLKHVCAMVAVCLTAAVSAMDIQARKDYMLWMQENLPEAKSFDQWKEKAGTPEGSKLPTVIWLHGYHYPLGYVLVYRWDLHPILALVKEGSAVLAFSSSLLKEGENSIVLTMPAGSLNSGILYDYIRLETN